MKYGQSLLLSFALFGTVAAPFASADAMADLQAQFGLKLKLTANTETYGTYALKGSAYDSTAKFVSITYTEKDWLNQLIADGEIPGPLSGWSIVARTDSESFAALNYRLYAVKKNQPDYPLDPEEARSLALEAQFFIEEFKARYVFATELFTGSGTLRENVLGTFTSDGDTLYIGGLATIPYSYKTLVLNQSRVSVLVPGSIAYKVTGGGVFTTEDSEPFQVIAEGEISLKSHIVTSLYPVATE